MERVEPLNHTLVIRLAKPDSRSKGGIIIPERARKKVHFGEIIWFAENCEAMYSWEKGQHVWWTGEEVVIRIDGEEYCAVHEECVLCRVDPIPSKMPDWVG